MKVNIKDKVLLIIGGTFLIILIGLLFFDIARKGIYRTRLGLNVVVVGDNGISLLLLRPEEEMVGWIELPSNIRIKIFNSSANYPVGSLWEYGVIEKNPYDIVEMSLGESMGVVLARTIKINDSSLIENVLGSILSVSLKTDLSFRDRIMIRKFLTESLKYKKVLEFVVPDAVFNKVVDPDGVEFLEFNSTIGLWNRNKFVIEPVLSENADVSINNVSNIPGNGSVFAYQLESAGIHVVEVKANLEENVNDDFRCIYSSNKRFEITEIILSEQLGCKRIAKPSFVDDDEKIRIWVK